MANDTTEVLYNGQFLALCRRQGWEYCTRPKAHGVVAIIALTAQGELVFTEQYRPPVQSRVIEYPAGLIGDEEGSEGESIMAAAARELEEETGYRAAAFSPLIGGPTSPGMSSELIHFVRAHDITRVGLGGGVGDESIDCHEVPLAEAAQWLQQQLAEGKMVEPKVYAGLYLAMQMTRAS